MAKYILKRILLLIPTLLVVTIVTFALMRMMPGSAVDMILNKYQAMGFTVDRATVLAQLGMDKPFVQQYFTWLFDLLRGDFGDSLFQNQSVLELIAAKMPITLELSLFTLIIINVFSIPLGIITAARQDSIGDYSARLASIVLMAVPTFWIGTLVLIYPAKWWGYAPTITYVSIFDDFAENMKMFLVPAVLGAAGQIGMQMRVVRTSLLDVMRQDYVRTAWSKGIKERGVLYGHAFRNSLIPVVTLVGGSVASLVGGSVILENLFNIPGLGSCMVTALNNYDYPLVQGCVVILAVIVMLINLLVDVTYKWCDPRVTLE
ncbi:MAG: ABC transporter permease [Oscillospiraceae bacterium]|nr:ABC transporter permease [Oscillospiraceae bacterium]